MNVMIRHSTPDSASIRKREIDLEIAGGDPGHHDVGQPARPRVGQRPEERVERRPGTTRPIASRGDR